VTGKGKRQPVARSWGVKSSQCEQKKYKEKYNITANIILWVYGRIEVVLGIDNDK
jgi:hypothetical protein